MNPRVREKRSPTPSTISRRQRLRAAREAEQEAQQQAQQHFYLAAAQAVAAGEGKWKLTNRMVSKKIARSNSNDSAVADMDETDSNDEATQSPPADEQEEYAGLEKKAENDGRFEDQKADEELLHQKVKEHRDCQVANELKRKIRQEIRRKAREQPLQQQQSIVEADPRETQAQDQEIPATLNASSDINPRSLHPHLPLPDGTHFGFFADEYVAFPADLEFLQPHPIEQDQVEPELLYPTIHLVQEAFPPEPELLQPIRKPKQEPTDLTQVCILQDELFNIQRLSRVRSDVSIDPWPSVETRIAEIYNLLHSLPHRDAIEERCNDLNQLVRDLEQDPQQKYRDLMTRNVPLAGEEPIPCEPEREEVLHEIHEQAQDWTLHLLYESEDEKDNVKFQPFAPLMETHTKDENEMIQLVTPLAINQQGTLDPRATNVWTPRLDEVAGLSSVFGGQVSRYRVGKFASVEYNLHARGSVTQVSSFIPPNMGGEGVVRYDQGSGWPIGYCGGD